MSATGAAAATAGSAAENKSAEAKAEAKTQQSDSKSADQQQDLKLISDDGGDLTPVECTKSSCRALRKVSAALELCTQKDLGLHFHALRSASAGDPLMQDVAIQSGPIGLPSFMHPLFAEVLDQKDFAELHAPTDFKRVASPLSRYSDGEWSRAAALIAQLSFEAPDAKPVPAKASKSFLIATASSRRLLLYPNLARFSHSCAPNAVHTASGIVFASRDVAKGERVSVSWHTQLEMLPRALRRSELKRVWGHDCRCERCCKPAPADRLLDALTGVLRMPLHPSVLSRPLIAVWLLAHRPCGRRDAREADGRARGAAGRRLPAAKVWQNSL